MLEFKTKDEMFELYKSRYEELDREARRNIYETYEKYYNLVKDCSSKDEVEEIFSKLEEENERKYKISPQVITNDSPHERFMEILANYGMIVFFRDNILKI